MNFVGMHDIHAVLKRTAKVRRSKGIVYDQDHSLLRLLKPQYQLDCLTGSMTLKKTSSVFVYSLENYWDRRGYEMVLIPFDEN